MKEGLFQSAEEEKVQILRLNIGPSEPVSVTSDTITVTRTLTHLIPDGNRRVRTILGGEEGDIIALTGEGNIRLRQGGNIAEGQRLTTSRVVMLIYVDGEWLQTQ